nr:zinc finger, CCHC-type [Tanacetum cinerariifolium]
MCMQSWDRSSYAGEMIELRADVELKDTIMVAMPKLGDRFLNVATSGTSTTPIVKRINKIERQIIVKKLTIVDDDGKPLAKVVSTVNMDSDSEVEDVVDDRLVFMASTCLKCGVDSEYGGYRHVKVLKFFDCLSLRQGVEDLRELLHKDKQHEEKKNTDCLVKEQEKEYHPVYPRLFWAEDTTRNMGFNESGEYKKTFIGSGVGTGSVQVLQGVEFKVEPQEDHKFKVEPYRNVDHVVDSHEVQTQDLIYYHPIRDREQYSAWELFSYREDFKVAAVEKIYAHELLTFKDTVAYDVISKWKARLKEDMDGLLDKAKENVLGMKIIKNQSGNTLRVSQSEFYNKKLVQTILEGHSILSLEGSLSGDCDVEKNASCESWRIVSVSKGCNQHPLTNRSSLRFYVGWAKVALNPNCGVQESNDVNNDTIDEYAVKLSGIASKSTTLEEVTSEHKLLKKFLTNLYRRFVHIVAPLEQVSDLETTRFKDVVERLKAGDRFAVAAVEKIYAHELLTFNDTVSYDAEIWVTKGLLDKAKGNTMLEGHFILSLEGSLSRDCDMEKNNKWSCIYAVGSQEYQMVCTRHDIASTNVEYMTFTEAWKKEIWLKGLLIESRYELRLVVGIATCALVKGGSQYVVSAQVEVTTYRY